ncbi:hypothetical protein MalM25_03100 [Planctomycetes bacterium MalM25]|nr:hypothetical protein MalM25_03100 [Planctomycetes bacterium MalM25]
MLTFVFFVAVLNLSVGYALGRGLTLSDLLELIPRRTPKPKDDDLDDDIELTEPVYEEEAVEEDGPAQPTPDDMLASLASFRDKLNSTSIELKLKKEDGEKFEETACKLQQANHDYLEEAEGAIEHLGQLGADGDAVAEATRDAVAQGSEQVAKMSGEIDGYLEAGLDDEESRSKLISKAAEMRDVATELQETTSVAIAKAEAEPADAPSKDPAPPADEAKAEAPVAPKEKPSAATTLESIDELLEQLGAALETAEEETVEHLAAIRLDPLEGHEDNAGCRKTVEATVERLAMDCLGDGHAFLRGEPAMMLLKGDSYDDALKRIEGLRELVASTTYSHDGEQVNATITCALADARTGDARDQVIEQLSEALSESATGGVNRTYHHDGAFPTAVAE